MTTRQTVMGQLISPAVLASAIVWTMTSITQTIASWKQDDLFVSLFAVTIAVFTVVPFLNLKIEGKYDSYEFFSDLGDGFLMVGIFYYLGLIGTETHCLIKDQLNNSCVPWAYLCVSFIAILSIFDYREGVTLPSTELRWGAIIFFLFAPLVGAGFLMEVPGTQVHWGVSIIMLGMMLCYVWGVMEKYKTIKSKEVSANTGPCR